MRETGASPTWERGRLARTFIRPDPIGRKKAPKTVRFGGNMQRAQRCTHRYSGTLCVTGLAEPGIELDRSFTFQLGLVTAPLRRRRIECLSILNSQLRRRRPSQKVTKITEVGPKRAKPEQNTAIPKILRSLRFLM